MNWAEEPIYVSLEAIRVMITGDLYSLSPVMKILYSPSWAGAFLAQLSNSPFRFTDLEIMSLN